MERLCQNSKRRANCPTRFPPLSAPRALVIRPNAMLVMLVPGSLRFGWLGRFLNEASKFSRFPSDTRNDLPSPIDRLNVAGPIRVPTPALPKRPMGVTLQLNWLDAPGTRPGHTKAAR